MPIEWCPTCQVSRVTDVNLLSKERELKGRLVPVLSTSYSCPCCHAVLFTAEELENPLDELIFCEDDFNSAFLSRDLEKLSCFYAPNALIINHFGKVVCLKDELKKYQDPTYTITRIKVHSREMVSIREEAGAVVVSNVSLQGLSGESPVFEHLIYTRVWERIEGRWQLIVSQETRKNLMFRSVSA